MDRGSRGLASHDMRNEVACTGGVTHPRPLACARGGSMRGHWKGMTRQSVLAPGVVPETKQSFCTPGPCDIFHGAPRPAARRAATSASPIRYASPNAARQSALTIRSHSAAVAGTPARGGARLGEVAEPTVAPAGKPGLPQSPAGASAGQDAPRAMPAEQARGCRTDPPSTRRTCSVERRLVNSTIAGRATAKGADVRLESFILPPRRSSSIMGG
jgi:hypothetical protein